MPNSSFFNPLTTFSSDTLIKRLKSMTQLFTHKKDSSKQSFSQQLISIISYIWETLKIKRRDLTRMLREHIDEMRKEWVTSLSTYKIYFQLLKITEQRFNMALMLALTLASAGLPFLAIRLDSLWTDSLANKSVFIAQAGAQLIIGSMIICIISFIADLVKQRMLQNVKVSINKKVLRILHNKNQFLRTLEEDAQTRLAHEQGRLNDKATIVQTLTKELDAFAANFIKMQESYIHFAPMMIMAFLQLYLAGVLVKGLMFLCVTQTAVSCFMMLCEYYLRPSQLNPSQKKNHNMETDLMKWSGEESQAAESALQRDFQYIMTRCRVAMYPNYIRRIINNLDNQVKRYTDAKALFQFFESINIALTDFISRITAPLFIIIVFLKKYLNSHMTYSELLNFNGPVMLLGIGSSWLGRGMTTCRKTLHTQANHINQMLNSIALDNRREQSPPTTFEGLSASGSLSYDEQTGSKQRVLRFTAAIYHASTNRSVLKRYGTEENPILLKPHHMINVIGHNGAGKSIMFNALSKMYPGIEVSPEIHKNPEFSLYCEQNIFEMPAVEGQCWGPRELMHLIWPTEQSCDGGCFTHQHGNTDLNQLMKSTNEYLKALHFRIVVPGVNGKQMIIDNTQGLENHQISFETMSGGEKAKLRLALYFAMAEVIQPRILLIDEPYNHINEHDHVRSVLKSMRDKLKNSTILVVTHQDCDSQRLKNYDQVLLVDKTSQDAIRYYGAAKDYSQWLKNTEPAQVNRVSAHEVFGIPG